MTVGSTFLYGCETWVLTQDLASTIRSSQRKMLRMILGSGRRVMDHDESGVAIIEPWSAWIIRTTHKVENITDSLNLRDWVQTQYDCKQRWHRMLVESERESWAKWILDWSPEGVRRVGRPKTRWMT